MKKNNTNILDQITTGIRNIIVASPKRKAKDLADELTKTRIALGVTAAAAAGLGAITCAQTIKANNAERNAEAHLAEELEKAFLEAFGGTESTDEQ